MTQSLLTEAVVSNFYWCEITVLLFVDINLYHVVGIW